MYTSALCIFLRDHYAFLTLNIKILKQKLHLDGSEELKTNVGHLLLCRRHFLSCLINGPSETKIFLVKWGRRACAYLWVGVIVQPCCWIVVISWRLVILVGGCVRYCCKNKTQCMVIPGEERAFLQPLSHWDAAGLNGCLLSYPQVSLLAPTKGEELLLDTDNN